MTRLPVAVVALVASLALIPAAGAAAKPGLHVADLVGDANAVNGQGFGLPLPATSTAASVKGADIAGFDLVNVFKGSGKQRKPAGFRFTLRFVGPVQEGLEVVVTMDTSASCGSSSRIQLGYQSTPAATSELAICQSASPGGSSTPVGVTEVAANGLSITWSIDNVLPARALVWNVQASTTVFVLGVFDEATTDKSFRYGA